MTDEHIKAICGIVMPISEIDGCTESHWADVLEIITEAVEDANFSANLVSNADDVGIIHKRIIQNLYDNPIVVCDVSGKNPNVMFELGLRLAFDKPTIIVKDDKTSYSFDTSAIEHIEYPRDLRFSKIVEFKEKLSAKISATHEKATQDKNFTTFLKHFGEFTVAKLQKKEVSGQEFILEELKGMRYAIQRLEHRKYLDSRKDFLRRTIPSRDIDICLGGRSEAAIEKAFSSAKQIPELCDVEIFHRSPDHAHILASIIDGENINIEQIEERIGGRVRLRRLRNRSANKTSN
ncbi:hypothetical protein GCM10027285_16410 [Oleiagrimonas citrea]|uniref:hypothetical protein n=1 Tax=Oleiagrimonas citrea TaxID=1665687 RepID=UPI0019638851|nr:hypothetical protein [Oleiagrimonas citrea]